MYWQIGSHMQINVLNVVTELNVTGWNSAWQKRCYYGVLTDINTYIQSITIFMILIYFWGPLRSGGASSENSPGPGKVLEIFARSL